MRNPKLPYSTPTMEKAVVELESPICGGSVDLTGQANGASIKNQEIATDFEKSNDFSSTKEWD